MRETQNECSGLTLNVLSQIMLAEVAFDVEFQFREHWCDQLSLLDETYSYITKFGKER